MKAKIGMRSDAECFSLYEIGPSGTTTQSVNNQKSLINESSERLFFIFFCIFLLSHGQFHTMFVNDLVERHMAHDERLSDMLSKWERLGRGFGKEQKMLFKASSETEDCRSFNSSSLLKAFQITFCAMLNEVVFPL